MRVLAFDFGLRHIGVAAGNTEAGTASAERALHARDGVVAGRGLEQLFAQWLPDICVVGLPLNMDGTEQDMTGRARRFAARLKAQFGVPVVLVDERLTSKAARDEIFAAGGYRALDKDLVDSTSARLLLEQYLSQRQESGAASGQAEKAEQPDQADEPEKC